ncbi:MAG: protein TolQ [Deltaproteobacteria bacterium]|nr:protein TolQ [Deltaproteobacteria bacterium]
MIAGAGGMVKFVLFILFLFSVVSWAIIVYKIRLLRRMERETAAFYDLFWKNRQFAQIYSSTKNYDKTPLAAIFKAVYSEITSTVKTGGNDAGAPSLQKDDIDRLNRVLRKAVATESARLEHAVGFLATTGNTAPFIGLFGTVWGIMTSFQSIGARGAANLAIVAPGISEALVATAMGLAAAIPAVVGYNHIVSRINRLNVEMDNFSADLLNIIERQIPRQ